jgi:hypothetical protein
MVRDGLNAERVVWIRRILTNSGGRLDIAAWKVTTAELESLSSILSTWPEYFETGPVRNCLNRPHKQGERPHYLIMQI